MIYTGISGTFENEQLGLLPVVETTWSMWKQMHPDTRVAQVGTGLERYSEGMPDRAVVNDLVGQTPLVVVHDAASRTAIPYSRIVDRQMLTFYRLDEGQKASRGLPVIFMDVETRTQWNMQGEAIAGQLEDARLAHLPAYNSTWFT